MYWLVNNYSRVLMKMYLLSVKRNFTSKKNFLKMLFRKPLVPINHSHHVVES